MMFHVHNYLGQTKAIKVFVLILKAVVFFSTEPLFCGRHAQAHTRTQNQKDDQHVAFWC